MRAAACLLLSAMSVESAFASGGISCTAEDEAVVLAVEGGVTRGMGSALFSFSGQVELRAEGIEEDLRDTGFGREHVAQYWLDGEVLRLRLYREREGDAPHGYVEAVLDTAFNEGEGDYRGDYRVTVYDMAGATGGEAATAEFSGAAACFAE